MCLIMMIKIRSRDLEKMISHCREEWPIEACGVLAGKIGDEVKNVLKVYKCENELGSPLEYRIEAEEQFKIFREIEKLGLDLLGFYHSHPSTSSDPSAVDKEKANYIGYSYMIVSLHPVRVSSWVLENIGIFKEEEIQTI